MPSPKSGQAPSPVPPAPPKTANEAATANPGSTPSSQAQPNPRQKTQLSGASYKPHKPPETEEQKKQKPAWIEIELVDEADQPVSGECYRITLPDGSVAEGSLDEKGFARIEGITPGNCQVTFPNLDESAWTQA